MDETPGTPKDSEGMQDKTARDANEVAHSATPQITFVESIQQRIDGQKEWLLQSDPFCFQEQKHLIDGSSERIYWHYGYMIALRDVVKRIAAQDAELKALRQKVEAMGRPVSDEEIDGMAKEWAIDLIASAQIALAIDDLLASRSGQQG